MAMNQSYKIAFTLLAAIALFLGGCEKVKDHPEPEEVSQNTDASEHLKELDWLVGKWIDEDKEDDVSLELSYAWDPSGNFIIQHFTMQVDNKKFEGIQIIGWDPIQDKLRSWIFDSAGGFGESIWSKQDNKWVVKTVFTLADGGQASAMHVYTKISENAYTFAAENRDIDGSLLPNVGPFKVIRQRG